MLRRYESLSDWREHGLPRRAVYTIGNFDGVHRGHQRLLAELAALARERGIPAIAVSFQAHTQGILSPDEGRRALTTREKRASLLAELGIDALIELEFDAALAALTGGEFLAELVGESAAGFVVGEDFRFGAGRSAGADELAKYLAHSAGGKLVTLPPLCEGGERISSSRIRSLLLAGDVGGARVLLGREYSLRGARKTGDTIASRLGYPTVNLSEIGTIVPADGVYAARLARSAGGLNRCERERVPTSSPSSDSACRAGTFLPAMVYIGTRPTNAPGERRVEAHVLDSHPEFENGEGIELYFVRRIRDEIRFSDETALLAQLARDKQAAREALLI